MRRLIKFIKEDILHIRPIFMTRVKYFWWSTMYCYIEYTDNNGWKWHPILGLSTELESGLTYKTTEIKSYHIDYVTNALESFNTLDKCLKHNEEMVKKANESRKELDKKLENRAAIIKNGYSKFYAYICGVCSD